MAENGDTETRRKGPSAVLLLSGVLALLVSVWALAGPGAWDGIVDIHLGWVVVVIAIVVGLGLVFSPGKR